MSFPYRRWYAELSSSDLSSFLDVGLTGAPDYVKAQYPNQKYVPLLRFTTQSQLFERNLDLVHGCSQGDTRVATRARKI